MLSSLSMQNDNYLNQWKHLPPSPPQGTYQDNEAVPFDYDEEQRTQEMLRYVEPPIQRNGQNDTDYKNTLSAHYRAANKYWDMFKSPAYAFLQSPEEAEQQKRADELYTALRNDFSTNYRQLPFEEQQAKEIAKITYKTDFQRIMNEPDSRRMNIINKMLRNRTKLQPSVMPKPSQLNDIKEPNSEHQNIQNEEPTYSTDNAQLTPSQTNKSPIQTPVSQDKISQASALEEKQSIPLDNPQHKHQAPSPPVVSPINQNTRITNNYQQEQDKHYSTNDNQASEERMLYYIQPHSDETQEKTPHENNQSEDTNPDADAGFLDWVEKRASNLTTSAFNKARTAANILLASQLTQSNYLSQFNTAIADSISAIGMIGTLSLLDSAKTINPLSSNAASILRSAAGYVAEASKVGSDIVDYADLVQREALFATFIANNAGLSAGKKYLKNKVAGDIPRYSKETIDWLNVVQPTIKAVNTIFGDNNILALSTSMAACEELNRRGNVVNRIGDAIQDQLVSSRGEVFTWKIISPNLGAANINMETSMNLKSRLHELPNPNHPDMLEMKRKVLGTEKELSQYLLTAKGTFMLGNSIMYLIMQDVERLNLFPADMPEKDIIQNLVDIWREGPDRIARMLKNKTEAETQGKTYYPKHKHQHNNITEENLNNMMRIIHPAIAK